MIPAGSEAVVRVPRRVKVLPALGEPGEGMSVLFPRWFNVLPTVGAVGAAVGLVAVVGGFYTYATPEFWEVGYMPVQPGGGFNHQIHAGKLGMDCRYCHTKVETSAEANVPNVATCYGCHADGRLAKLNTSTVHKDKTNFIREAHAKDETPPWARVHKLPDYVRNFPHHVHVVAGVSCYSCHGQIMGMPVVYQAKSLSMSWCLDCHKGVQETPEKYLVPKDKVTDLVYVEQRLADPGKHSVEAKKLLEALKTAPPDNCGACHY